MSMDQPSSFKLGKWLVEPPLGRLSSGDSSASIRPREMDLLVYLAERQGAVVTTDDIMSDVWDGVTVTNDSLYFSMSQLRKALDDEESSRSIETLPKRGYRLLAPSNFRTTHRRMSQSILNPLWRQLR